MAISHKHDHIALYLDPWTYTGLYQCIKVECNYAWNCCICDKVFVFQQRTAKNRSDPSIRNSRNVTYGALQMFYLLTYLFTWLRHYTCRSSPLDNLPTTTLLTRNAWQSLAYSPLGTVMSPLNFWKTLTHWYYLDGMSRFPQHITFVTNGLRRDRQTDRTDTELGRKEQAVSLQSDAPKK